MSEVRPATACADYLRDPEAVGICLRCRWPWQDHAAKPVPPPLDLSSLTVSGYIQRIEKITAEETVDGPLPVLARTQVLAELYQAKALQEIAGILRVVMMAVGVLSGIALAEWWFK